MSAESSSSWTFPNSLFYFLLIHTKTSQKVSDKSLRNSPGSNLSNGRLYRGQILEHQRRVKKKLQQQDDMNIVPDVFTISSGGVGSFFFLFAFTTIMNVLGAPWLTSFSSKYLVKRLIDNQLNKSRCVSPKVGEKVPIRIHPHRKLPHPFLPLVNLMPSHQHLHGPYYLPRVERG